MGLSNTTITEKTILEQVADISNQLIREEFDRTFSLDIVSLYNVILNANSERILFDPSVSCLMILTKKIYSVPGCSYVKELVEELEKKIVRFSILDQSKGVINSYNSVLRNTSVAERYIPNENDTYRLPPQGKTLPITIRRPDRDGRFFSRKVLIDCEGFVVDELESFYDDERDEDANNVLYGSFSKDLMNVKDSYVRTDDILDAEKNCNGEEVYSTENTDKKEE